jgi:hypothetical protein
MSLMDDIFRAAALRGNSFTSAELAEDLSVAPDEVAKQLKILASVDAAKHDKNKWSLSVRRTEARDRIVAAKLSTDGVSREKLNELLPDFSPAQVYTSLQRLILVGKAAQSRDGSRTPKYEAKAA